MARTLDYYWDFLVEMLGISEDCLQCMTNIHGYSMDTLNYILYWKTGENDLEEYVVNY